ncbi:MAG: preprotein translocase subunit SecE [Anaerolineae bacterium]|nr:preprotein translocase subunit SecE [Anaerolineae bacterium]
MAKAKAKDQKKAKKENAIIRYIKDTRSELKKIKWPTREETVRLTQLVLVVTVVMGLFLWAMDVLFSWWLGGILTSNPWSIGLVIVTLVVGVAAFVILRRRQGQY